MIKKQGIILNLMDYQESHKILYILTKDKVESLLVRRAKRYNSGILNAAQKLTKVEYVSNEKNLPSTNELSIIDNFFVIKDDIDKIILCEYICEVLYKITLEYNFNILYSMVNKLLEEIKIREDYSLLFLQFKIKMLYFYGIVPNFKECYKCGSNEIVGLSLKNGCECIQHKSSDNIGLDSTKIIYLLYKDQFNITDINIDVIKHLNNIIDKFYKNHFFMEFKSEELLKKHYNL